ncbi:hypothetical protein [Candidatus Deferrimicrobium sp.]|uniref:hypothetical protein n=1 Tax=Candidatus Deferrimicrobium sp. TaxID=3060586 RepID=UPI003C4EA8C5
MRRSDLAVARYAPMPNCFIRRHRVTRLTPSRAAVSVRFHPERTRCSRMRSASRFAAFSPKEPRPRGTAAPRWRISAGIYFDKMAAKQKEEW